MYHVFNRGNGGKDIFGDALDYQRFLDELSRQRERGLTFFGYCLMPNHFHLLVRVADTPLADLMQAALARYSQYFNFRRGTFGSVFQPRYKANLIDSNAYFFEALRYIHLNPTAAGLVSRPEDWKWSGHNALIGRPDQLMDGVETLRFFSVDSVKARGMYLEFLEQRRDSARLFEERKPAASHDLGQIATDCAQAFLIPLEQLKALGKQPLAARSRRLFVRRALECGFKRPEIAGFLGCDPSAISKLLGAGRFLPGISQ